jgi:protein gp37
VKNSKIEWCDHTFNPWEGCTKVSPGCAHCYAETRNQRFAGGVNWGPGAPRRRTSAANWRQPLAWNLWAENAQIAHWPPSVPYVRPRVFCASLGDVFDSEVPDEWWRNDLFDLIFQCKNLDWLILTKRPALARDYLCGTSGVGAANLEEGGCFEHVWLGTTVEDQQRADERIPALLSIPARVRFLSCEPLLGPVDLRISAFNGADSFSSIEGIHWVICGGESGPKARPMHPDWARSLRDQCAAAGVPFLFKQWGEWLPGEATPDSGTAYRRCDNGQIYGGVGNPRRENFGTHPDPHSGRLITLRVGKASAGRRLDGREHNEFPA